jgi:crotonobetainyl-CoA:carnitine CoA-transferase CaiB-like acyl-CoA transferase
MQISPPFGRRPYRTSDGYIAALIYNDKHWAAFIAVYALLAETLAQRTTREWLELFRELEIPAAALSSPAALFDDPHLNAVGFFETVDTPHGPVRFPGVPTWFSRTPGRVAGPAPELGADTAGVLEELGLAPVDGPI